MAMSETGRRGSQLGGKGIVARLAGRPFAWIAAFAAMAAVALTLPLRLPLGPNAWDTVVYLDAIQRIGLGQVPTVDFFVPIGPLGFYLAAGLDALFPDAQPMLLINWALLPVMLPVLALLAGEVSRRSRPQALALTLPFLMFAALPVNLHGLYPHPGFDGYGFYNRHVALLLYLLIATLLFVPRRALRIALVAVLMLTLFLTKVTGAVSGTLLVGYAALAGRMRFRDAFAAAAIVLLALGLLEVATGLSSAYLSDILTLLSLNTGTLLPRFLTVASVKFNVIGPSLLLIVVLAVAAWRDGLPATLSGWRALADQPVGWFVLGLAALALFETQNTGSLEFIGLWPILLPLLTGWWRRREDRMRPLVLVLALAVALPSAVICVERGMRALMGAPTYVGLDLPDLGPLGRVEMKPDIAARAAAMLDHYATHQEAYSDLVRRDILPSYILYSEIDFQATWLLEIQQAVTAIRNWEAANKRELNGFFTFDFVDPLNYLMERTPPRVVPVGVDPGRSTPVLEPGTLEALRRTDAILMPKCPVTTQREAIREHFAAALNGREPVALAPCWDMYLRK
ncbi:hypothetical protein [Bosea sp. (in: a-proteobacteria)]|uniref:hypothetical protein n=1 Tax=Bosea sp. (in: a-proteobacteria) TaxID=1871050 RepID=UPI0026034044|nr:hypothetical protein [Bosea sp. (in: a-proteobacteria)]MCO5090287.1 hypothetical protein [Bosea sp. (in: a-proteobacteria)]